MKYLILFILSINTALACQLLIPESYITTFLNPPVSGHYEKCGDKPAEKCHCVDNVDPWNAELIDNEVLDYVKKTDSISCENESDCDAKFLALECKQKQDKIKNYEQLEVYCIKPVMKIEGKKLANSEAKKAAFEAKKVAEKLAEKDKSDRKKATKEALKNVDIEGANTVAKLKAIVKLMLEAQE